MYNETYIFIIENEYKINIIYILYKYIYYINIICKNYNRKKE